ncbi:MAG: TetR family transcriptional regulator [Desulfovibrio sp.]|jgi:TetR/AcrR family transcriptional repressor of nem operon|nr:TetR family transcriptional regulator [Desulfovibrio sp.]
MASRREEIVKASALLISKKGYLDTSLSDILDEAKIGKGQFYHYFSSKHDLGSAVIDDCLHFFNRKLFIEVLDSSKDAGSRFEDMLTWIVAFHRRRNPELGCFFGNMALEVSGHDEFFRLKLQRVFEMWAGNIEVILREMFGAHPSASSPGPEEWVEDASTRSDEIRKLSLTIVGMLEGGFLIMKNYRDLQALEEMIDSIRFMVEAYRKKFLEK